MQWMMSSKNILLTGSDKAGKSALLRALAGEPAEEQLPSPTRMPVAEHFTHDGKPYSFCELRRDKVERWTWEQWSRRADAIVFMLDAAEDEDGCMNEAISELIWLLESAPLHDVPVLVLCNKIDLRAARSPAELAHRTDLARYTCTQARPLAMYFCSVRRQMQGTAEAFGWLFSMIV
jgi:GTPase SAR1 family protein